MPRLASRQARSLKLLCTQEKESPVNRLSVILFGGVPILPAPALPACGTGLSPSNTGEPQRRAQRGCCRARSVPTLCPHTVSPSRDALGTGPPQPCTAGAAVATLTGGTGCPGDPAQAPEVPSLMGSPLPGTATGPWGQLPKWPRAGAGRPLFPNTICPQVQFNFPPGRWPAPRTARHLPTPSALAPSSLARLPFPSSA